MAGTAIIGLGAMGMGMARNILAAGVPLEGFDLSEDARARFGSLGGGPAASASEAAKGVDLLIVMVVNAAQAHAALFDSGAAAAMADDGTVVLSSTIAPKEARKIGERLGDMGLMMLDAPVSGGQVGAEAGTLTVMASGPDAAFARADTVLKAVSKVVHRLGDAPGMGSTYKVVHQLAAGVHLVAAAEVFSLGKEAGCDPERLLEIVAGAAGQSWMMDDRGPRMLQDDPPVTSTVEIFIKDMSLVLAAGADAGQPLPLSTAALDLLKRAAELGHGRDDDSMVIRAYEALAREQKDGST